MEQRISLVTLGVADLARARTFYERYDFRQMTDDEYRLFIPMKQIAASLL